MGSDVLIFARARIGMAKEVSVSKIENECIEEKVGYSPFHPPRDTVYDIFLFPVHCTLG